jgi:hypothetical protein
MYPVLLTCRQKMLGYWLAAHQSVLTPREKLAAGWSGGWLFHRTGLESMAEIKILPAGNRKLLIFRNSS